jgi:hypothetical protein
MIIYNPHNEEIIRRRWKKIQEILSKIPAKHCFITGSYLWKDNYKDIDTFAVTRKKIKGVATIDFNDIYSLFYHSITKSSISKDILPKKPLKATVSDFWNVINEAIPTILNEQDRYHKNIRFLVLYTEYFKTNYVLDTYELSEKIAEFRNYKDILAYIKTNIPPILNKHAKKSYIKRFFYTQAGFYKESVEYDSVKYLYDLSHTVIGT